MIQFTSEIWGFVKGNQLGKGNQYNLTHGESVNNTPEYVSWRSMIERCCNPHSEKYHLYGGRGIVICYQWLNSYSNFLVDVGRKPTPYHTLDRIDNEGNYTLGNVKWSTPREQANNRRTNRRLTVDGKSLTLAEWARGLQTTIAVLRYRISKGWSLKDVVTIPVSRSNTHLIRKEVTC